MQVLVIFPTTIRRRILRHLYLRQVRMAYLFKGVRQKFIDAILGVARIELFMPQARPCSLLYAFQLLTSLPGIYFLVTRSTNAGVSCHAVLGTHGYQVICESGLSG